MSTFVWSAVDPSGRRLNERASATDAASLRRSLEARGLMVLSVTERRAAGSRGRAARRDGLEFLRTLATVLGAGVPLATAIAISADLGRLDARPMAADIEATVRGGAALTAAMARQPGYFSPMTIGIVGAGEESGLLQEAMAAVVEYLEREADFRARLTSASIYPLILLCTGVVTVGVMVLFVLPRFAELIQSAGQDLPAATQALMSIHAWVSSHPTLLGAALLIWVGVFAVLVRTEAGSHFLARTLLRAPVLGRVRRCVLGARFARSLGLLINGGTPIVRAVITARSSVADPIARDDIARLARAIETGKSLRHGLSNTMFMTPTAVRLISVGEQTGDLSRHLKMTADVMEAEARRTLERLLSLAEPAMILAFGAMVGFVAIALLQAVYGLNTGSFR